MLMGTRVLVVWLLDFGILKSLVPGLVAMNPATARKQECIVLGTIDAASQRTAISAALAQGIKIIGWHSAGTPGPQQDLNLITNIESDPVQTGAVSGAYTVAMANGQAGVAIFTDNTYAIAVVKSDAMRAAVDASPTITGTIGWSPGKMSKPSPVSCSRNHAVFSRSVVRRLSSPPSSRSRTASEAPTTAGATVLENGYGRDRWRSTPMICLRPLVYPPLGALPPYLTKLIIDGAIRRADARELAIFVGAMIASALVSTGIGTWQGYLNALVGEGIMRDMRDALVRHLHRMPLSFFASTKTGEIMNRVSNDVDNVDSVVTGTLVTIVTNVAMILTTVDAIFLLDWRLALLSLAVVPEMTVPLT